MRPSLTEEGYDGPQAEPASQWQWNINRGRTLFFQILGSTAEFVHALMSERTRDGLAAGRARGRTGGQKPKLTPRHARIVQAMHDELGPDGKRTNTVQRIAEEFGVSSALRSPVVRRKIA